MAAWSWALLERPLVVQLLKNFLAFYGTRRFITAFTIALHLYLSWARPIQSTLLHPISPSPTYVTTDGQSVSQHVKVSSPLWDLWPDITFCPKVVVWKLLSCLCRAPSLTRGRVYHFSIVTNQYLHQAFTLHVFYSSAIYIQYVQSFIQPRLTLTLSTHLRLGLPNGLLPSGFPTNNLHALFFYPFGLHTSPILDLIILIILGEEYKLWKSPLCCFLQPPVTSSLLDPNTLLSTLFFDALSLCSSRIVTKSKFRTHTDPSTPYMLPYSIYRSPSPPSSVLCGGTE
jgi:hypothetical protein